MSYFVISGVEPSVSTQYTRVNSLVNNNRALVNICSTILCGCDA